MVTEYALRENRSRRGRALMIFSFFRDGIGGVIGCLIVAFGMNGPRYHPAGNIHCSDESSLTRTLASSDMTAPSPPAWTTLLSALFSLSSRASWCLCHCLT